MKSKLAELNQKKFQKLSGCRQELFETLDRPALNPLPLQRHEMARWARPRVNIDYHIEVEKHLYSVPYQLRGQQVELRYTASIVEIMHKGKRVASHPRSFVKHKHTTAPEHMPESHRRYLEWSPSRFANWAGKIGISTQALVIQLLESRRYPEQAYRTCLGILRLGKRFSDERLERACERALRAGATSYRSVESILKNGLDREPIEPATEPTPIAHNNIRGQNYYN